MSKHRKKKERIFDVYSQNFAFVKKHPEIKIDPDIPNSYMCPLCLNGFTKADLSDTVENPLTFEDIPPKSMGGKPIILTCKMCNSTAGHKLDAHLLHILEDESFKGFSPNSKADVTYHKDGKKMNGDIKIDENGKWHMNFDPKRSNPKDANYILKELNSRSIRVVDYETLMNYKSDSFKFNFKARERGLNRNAEVNMLRIAYLLAFAKFGYGFIINPNLYKIREQILNPNEDILKQVFWLRYDFTDNYIGTHIIFHPKEMISFLIVFKLKTKSFNRNFGIVLPGPNPPGLKVYDFINDKLCVGDGTENCEFLMQPFSNTNFVSEERYAFASHQLWQNILNQNIK